MNEFAGVPVGEKHTVILGVFDGSGHANLGSSDDWGDPQKFFPRRSESQQRPSASIIQRHNKDATGPAAWFPGASCSDWTDSIFVSTESPIGASFGVTTQAAAGKLPAAECS